MAKKDSQPDSRDAKGQFVAGCAPGPGRPPKLREKAYFDAFRQTASLEDWQAAVEVILAKAIKGDLRAFEALAKYVMPSPAQRLEWQLTEERESEFRVAGATPEEIAARTAVILKSWSPRERASRVVDDRTRPVAFGERQPVPVVRLIDLDNHRAAVDALSGE